MIWADVVGFEGLYKISETGVIKSIERNGTKGGILKQPIDRYGYKKVVLYKNNKPHYFTAHRLVAITFIPNPENKETVNHINGNKLENHYTNLEWVSSKENLLHSFEIGKQKYPMQTIVATNLKTGEQMDFHSHKEASRQLGISQSTISRVVKGDYNQVKGYTFKRKEG